MKIVVLSLLTMALLNANSFYYEYGQKVEVSKISNKRSLDNSVEYYQKANGTQVGIKTDEILVKCHDGVNCKSLLDSYNFASVEALTQTIFLVTLQSKQELFSYAQQLHKSDKIEFAHPNFVKERKRR